MLYGFLNDRHIIRVTGADAVTFFQRILTLDIEKMEKFQLFPSALLTPQGKVFAEFLLALTDDGFILDVGTEYSADLIKRLKMLKLRADVSFEVTSLVPVLVPTLDAEGIYVDLRHDLAPNRHYQQVTSQTSAQLANWDDMRIFLGMAQMGQDFAPNSVFPTDVNLDVLGGLDYQKGCFIGQEVTSRMKRRGSIRRRTLKIIGKELCKGSKIFLDGVEVGGITSVNLTQNEALARIRVDRLGGATSVSLEGDYLAEICWPDYLEADHD